MAKKKLPPHRRFPSDDRIYRLTWFGDLRFNPSVTTEPLIEVYLVPLRDTETPFDTLDSAHAYDYTASRLIEVGIGYLPSLRIGSFWRNGLPYSLPQVKTRDKRASSSPYHLAPIFIESLTDRLPSFNSGDYIQRPETTKQGEYRDYFIPYAKYPLQVGGYFDPEASIARTQILRFACTATTSYDEEGKPFVSPITCLVPCVEILRFYYASSTALIREVIGGGIGKDVDDPHNTLYNPDPELTFINTDTGQAHIQLRRRMRDSDAPTLARTRFSPYAFAQTSNISKHIIHQCANNKPVSIVAYPPFECATEWRALGKPFHFGRVPIVGEPDTRHWHFLVYEILSCSAPFPFSSLKFDRDNDGRSQLAPETAEERQAKRIAYPQSSHKPLDEPAGGIHNDGEPSLDYPQYEVVNDVPRFLDLEDKSIEKLPQNRTTHRAAPSERPGAAETPDSSSTGTGDYGQSRTAPFAVTLSDFGRVGANGTAVDEIEEADENDESPTTKGGGGRGEAMPATLDEFRAVLKTLTEIYGVRWEFITIAPDNLMLKTERPDAFDSLEPDVSVFPLRLYKRDKKKAFVWSFIDAERYTVRRQVCIAYLNHNSRSYYLLEAEHLPSVRDADGNLLRREPIAMCLLAAKGSDEVNGYGKVSDDLLKDVLRHCVENRGDWIKSDELPELFRDFITHTSTETERTAERIFDAMQRLGSVCV